MGAAAMAAPSCGATPLVLGVLCSSIELIPNYEQSRLSLLK